MQVREGKDKEEEGGGPYCGKSSTRESDKEK
jgi:hypothetical protein